MGENQRKPCYAYSVHKTEKGCVSMGKARGRPPFYDTVDEIQEAIDAYFKKCEGEPLLDDEGFPIRDKYGEVIILEAKPPTVTGLALALGFTSRQALLNYQGKKKFVDTIVRAKSRIEEYAEGRLYDRDGQRGAEFSLKYNFRWASEEKEKGDDISGVVMMPEVDSHE